MDRKSIIILAVAIALLLVGSQVVDHFFPPKPIPPQALKTNVVAEAVPSATVAAPAVAAPAPKVPRPTAPEQTLIVSNQDLIWHFTSRGGGLDTVDLKDYPAAVIPPSEHAAVTRMASLNHNAPSPVLSVVGEGLAADDDYTLRREGGTVIAERSLSNGLRVVKEFDVGSNYLFNARLTFENTGTQPLPLPGREVVIGTSTAIGPLDDPTAMGTFWYNGIKTENIKDSWFANRTLGCIPGIPRAEYEGGAGNVHWAAVHNQFFALAAIPSNAAPRIVITGAGDDAINRQLVSNSMSALLTNGFEAALAYPALALGAHQKLTETFTFYAGPKEYKRLAQIGQKMDNNLDLIMAFTGPFGFFSKLLLLWMNGLHAIGLSYGLTIIAITLIIKGIFWPLTRASTKSQKRMQALQPQMKAIQERYKKYPMRDPKRQEMNAEIGELYKREGVNPAGGCLPLVIQMPFLWAFYTMLGSAIELRQAPFLWLHDLSSPDKLFIMPVVIVISTYLMQKMTPTSGMDPKQQQMMTLMMPLMIGWFSFNLPSGLSVYWTVGNLIGIGQQFIMNRSALGREMREEAEKRARKKAK